MNRSLTEIRKGIPVFAYLLIVCGWVALKIIILNVSHYRVDSYTAANAGAYRALLEPFRGRVTDATAETLDALAERYTRTYSQAEEWLVRYRSGEIDRAEVLAAFDAETDLRGQETLFLRVYDQYLYAREKPDERYLLDGNGWTALLTEERMDWLMIFVMLAFLLPLFSVEFDCGMFPLLLTFPGGGDRLTRVKLSLSVWIAVGLTLISILVETFLIHFKFGLLNGNYPLQSLRYFQASPLHVSFWAALGIVSGYRLIGAVLFSACVQFFVSLTRSSLNGAFMSVCLLAVPYYLPENAVYKYFFPSPLGFMIGQGYIRPGDFILGLADGGGVQAIPEFSTISPMAQAVSLLIAGLLLAGMIRAIYRLNGDFMRKVQRAGLDKVFIATIAAAAAILASANRIAASELPEIFNSSPGNSMAIVDGAFYSAEYGIRTIPDPSALEFRDAVRDPFFTQLSGDFHSAAIYVDPDWLYYAFQEDTQHGIANVFRRQGLRDYVDMEICRVELDYSDIVSELMYFIHDRKIYLLKAHTIDVIDPMSCDPTVFLTNVDPYRVSYDGESIYYSDAAYRLYRYDFSTGRSEAIYSEVRATRFFLTRDKLYYTSVLDDENLYELDRASRDSRLIAERVYNSRFQSDGEALYFYAGVRTLQGQSLHRYDLETGEVVDSEIFGLMNFGVFGPDDPIYAFQYVAGIDNMKPIRIDKPTFAIEELAGK